MTDQVQPRIGANYQVRKGVGDKVTPTNGRYFGLDQKSSARSMASGRLYTGERGLPSGHRRVDRQGDQRQHGRQEHHPPDRRTLH